MKSKDLIRLRHMLDSTQAILSFLKGKQRSDLDTDRLLLSGITRELEILGEAAGKVSLPTQHLFPDIPWRQLVGMRNRLIHAYFDVNHEVVWNTIKNDLPKFYTQLEKAIAQMENQ
ncbi:MAG: DUF86 domain-containing protein [Chlamydiota bacterium]